MYARWAYITSFCGGVAVGRRHVLIPAHCIDDRQSSSLEVWVFNPKNVGVWEPGQIISKGQRVARTYVHPDWRPEQTVVNKPADLAILEFNEALDSSIKGTIVLDISSCKSTQYPII